MQKNIMARIALCGLLSATNITLAMDDTINKALILDSNKSAQQQSNKKTVFNGYFTNNLNSLLLNLPIYEYKGEKGINNAVSKITYIDTETNTTQTVRFSGKNNSDERLEYNNEKYHVIINSEGKNLFTIKMNQTPTPSTSSGNSSTQRSGSISPRDDYDDSKFISPTQSQSNSPTQSPREKQTISQVLGGETQIIYEPISDNIGLTYKQPSPVKYDTITGLFAKDLSYNIPEIPVYDYISHQKLNNTHAQFTYKENNTIKTITLQYQNEHVDEEFLFVQENVMGLIKQYVINLNPESNTTSTDNEESHSLINSEEVSSEDSKETSSEQVLHGSLSNLSLVVGKSLTKYKGYITKFEQSKAEVTYIDENKEIKKIWVTTGVENPTRATIRDNQDRIVFSIALQGKPEETSSEQNTETNNNNNDTDTDTRETNDNSLNKTISETPTQQQIISNSTPSNTQYEVFITPIDGSLKNSTDTDNETLNSSTDSSIDTEKTLQDPAPQQQFTGFFTSEIFSNMDYCEGLTIEQTHEFHTDGFTTENLTLHPGSNYQYQIKYKNTTGDICTVIANCSKLLETTSAYIVIGTNPILAIKLPALEQIKETNSNNNNNNNDTKENESSNLPTSRKLTQAQTSLSHFCRTPHNSMPNEYKQYEGKIIESTKQGCRVVFTDENNIQQDVWVNGSPENATFALIKNTSNQIHCVVKLPTQPNVIDTDSAEESRCMDSDISKKSTPQHFNKNPNNRDPKYTYIGAAFLTLCIALAYKYNKLPDVCTKLLDQCFAQLNKLTPSRFSH